MSSSFFFPFPFCFLFLCWCWCNADVQRLRAAAATTHNSRVRALLARPHLCSSPSLLYISLPFFFFGAASLSFRSICAPGLTVDTRSRKSASARALLSLRLATRTLAPTSTSNETCRFAPRTHHARTHMHSHLQTQTHNRTHTSQRSVGAHTLISMRPHPPRPQGDQR